MDINYFLQRELVERVRADRAASVTARAAHRRMADCYRELLDGHRRELLRAAGLAPELRPPVL